MTDYTQRLYEVRYPNGSIVDIRAHMVFQNESGIGLKRAPGDNPGNVIFAASHQAGVTIRLVS